jgi:uncharacterized short protein YbdD (DUF466 family)
MNDPQTHPGDPLIDEVRETRERLVREHGGLAGWAKYLQELQKQHPEKLVARRTPQEK